MLEIKKQKIMNSLGDQLETRQLIRKFRSTVLILVVLVEEDNFLWPKADHEREQGIEYDFARLKSAVTS